MMNIPETLQEIRETSGNAKLELLKQHHELKDILEWTYNPFKKYNVPAPNHTIASFSQAFEHGLDCFDEKGDLHGVEVNILTELSARELSGHAAIKKIAMHFGVLSGESVELFTMIINKDLKLGLGVKTINKAFPGLIPLTQDGDVDIPIMLLKTFDPKKAKYPLMIAPKVDGVRGRFKNGYLYSRSKKRFHGLEHIENALENLGIGDADGEIFVPGNIFDDASGLIRNKQPVPEAVYYIFDLPGLDATSKKGRYKILMELSKDFPHCIKLVYQTYVALEAQLMQQHEIFLVQGFEGTVIYNPDSMYEDKRGYDWTRLVPLKTADCRCTRIFEGKGKYEFSAGGIVVNFDGKAVKVGTGFSDEDRKKMWEDPNHYIGLICEIEYKEKTKAGSMRQPRFKGWRLDKGEENFD